MEKSTGGGMNGKYFPKSSQAKKSRHARMGFCRMTLHRLALDQNGLERGMFWGFIRRLRRNIKYPGATLTQQKLAAGLPQLLFFSPI